MTLEHHEAVRATVMAVAHHIDAKRWDALRALYASEVETDYTSLFGGTPQRQSGDALIAGWRSALANVATQHLLGPIDVRVTGAVARAVTHVRALHHVAGAPGGAYWEVLGHYVFDLALSDANTSAWQISGMTLETIMQTGNPNLLAEASAGSV